MSPVNESQSKTQKKDAGLIDAVGKDGKNDRSHQCADGNDDAGTIKKRCADHASGNGANQKSGEAHEQFGQLVAEKAAQKSDDQRNGGGDDLVRGIDTVDIIADGIQMGGSGFKRIRKKGTCV